MPWEYTGVSSDHVSVYGASDDLCEVEGVDGFDEIDCGDGAVVIEFGDSTMGVRLRVFYSDAGVWCVGVEPIDEDVPMFSAATVLAKRGYSARCELGIPKGTSAKARRVPLRDAS